LNNQFVFGAVDGKTVSFASIFLIFFAFLKSAKMKRPTALASLLSLSLLSAGASASDIDHGEYQWDREFVRRESVSTNCRKHIVYYFSHSFLTL